MSPDQLHPAGPVSYTHLDVYKRQAQCQVQMFAAPEGTSRFGRVLRDFQDAEFRTTIAAMQVLRGYTLSVGLGGNGQFSRLAALDAIGASAGDPWHGSLLEDYELSLHLMLAGWQTRYLHAVSYTHLDVYKRQPPRRAIAEAAVGKQAPVVRLGNHATGSGECHPPRRIWGCLLYTSRCV